MMEGNRAFELMLAPAREWLEGRDPEEIARMSGAVYDAGSSALRLTSLGQAFEIHWPDCRVSPDVDAWWQLVMLHYLHGASGAGVRGELMNFAALQAGLRAAETTIDRAQTSWARCWANCPSSASRRPAARWARASWIQTPTSAPSLISCRAIR